ncbi:hypothetical protein OJF2_49030 [Aquisphaera giovannonii]|uniref:Uncharacterized protein n=1 Tax=Aquisphaera giovannonii TaxID=406548 RepID=A0A5B9W6Q6_9BACT|nr:hypothetical protein [Aquisphaera giovannonii]QEH36342.1 hypothetical protein OJF2_49030 [Aquisphaera giovannonii]
MSFRQQRSDRPASARRRRVDAPEALENRQVLSSGGMFHALYTPSDVFVTNPITHQRIPTSNRSLMQHNNPDSPLLSNQGKIVSGVDRQGNQWTITVHGPGQVIVTDTSPNDGSLDDDISTIQIINSNPRTTYVTGNTVSSNRVLGDGTVLFNRLIALGGVKSIELNGFDLSANVTPAVAQSPGVFLYGGVQTLKFHDIAALIDTSVSEPVYQIVIGDPSIPLKVQPSIYLDSIYNSVFDSTSTSVPSTPLTTPSVQFSVNGTIQNFSVVSVTQSAISPNQVAASQRGTFQNWTGVPAAGPISGAYQFFYNVVGTTGRTSLQADAINNLNVRGKATNFTAQRDTTPFTNNLSGLRYLRRASFGANADAVALDVRGNIGSLKFKKGLGDPTYTFTSTKTTTNSITGETTAVYLPASNYGTPAGSEGYPAHGLLGGAVRARQIGSLQAGPANLITLTAQNPRFVQRTPGRTVYYLANPGTAMTNAAVTAEGSIGKVAVTGNQQNTEIKTGFNYQSYLAGLEGTRAASRIARLRQRGDLVNSVDSATFRPGADSSGNFVYTTATGTAGNGSITGTTTQAVGYGVNAGSYARRIADGGAFATGGRTALGNFGAGYYARRVRGNIRRLHS